MYRAHIAYDPVTGEKREQSCTAHSRATAELAGTALSRLDLKAAGTLAGLLHDCGKFTAEFDEYLEKASSGQPVTKGSVIHTFAGVRYLLEHFHSRDGALRLSDVASEALAASIGGHHGLMDMWDERHQNGFDHRLGHQPAYDARAIAAFHEECADESEIRSLYGQAEQEILRFYHRIAGYAKGDNEGHYAVGMIVRLITSAVVDADRTDTGCFMQGIAHPSTTGFSWDACAAHVDAHLAGFPRESPIQAARHAFSDRCAEAAGDPPGLYRLDLPTGGGKTLAALRFAVQHAKAHGLQRVFYVAPLLSIIEQNADAIRRALGDTAPVLEHHSNVVRDEGAAEMAARSELLQETWAAPVIITTFVRLLETLFSGRMSDVRRFHCLSRSVIIIDEVQSLPAKLLSMFNGAVNFLTQCCGATVVLCSATQPPFDDVHVRHRMLPCRRLISEAEFDRYAPLFRRTEILDGGVSSLTGLVGQAEELIRSADSLLIVCNTKGEASELYHLLADIAGVRCFHLSAGMCMAHRRKTLDELTEALAAHEKLICVATQLIEAGVDLSFDAVIRLSAGLDNVVQTAGRCNRHGEHPTPRPVRILRLQGEKLGPLREIRAAQDALTELLEEYRLAPERYASDLASDAAVRAYYAFLYREMAVDQQDYVTNAHTLYDLLSLSQQFAPTGELRYVLKQAFRTAGDWFEVFDNASESVLVPFEQGAELIRQLDDEQLKYDLARAAQLLTAAKPYTVSMAMSRIERMVQQGMIFTLLDGSLYVLNDGCYDDQTGIKEGYDSCGTLIL